LIVVSICASIAVAESVNPKGVYLDPIDLGGEKVSYWQATMFCILLVISFLFVVAWVRAFKRRIDQTVDKTYLYLCARKVDQYYVICIVCYLVGIFWTLGFYSAFPYPSVLLTGILVPAIGFFFFNIIQVYIRNNFFFVVDCSGINRNIVAHNKRVDDLKAKGRELRKKIIEEGPESVYGEENGRLVQKVMDIEIARRQAAKLQAKIKGDDSDDGDFDQSLKKSTTGVMGRMKRKSVLSPSSSPAKASPSKGPSQPFAEEEKSQMSPDNTVVPGTS